MARPEQPVAETPPAAAEVPNAHAWFGHPRGLATLFFTEMWERFSYYGMRALLILYMTEETLRANPGLGYDVGRAAAVYGLYTGFVYLLALPGGWVADNLWGQRRAVFVGGCIIAAGHFSMAAPILGLPEEFFFFTGLILIVIGTGLLKPNVSTIVGELYPEGGARRDAGFSIFYMGINIGALLGPFVCSTLGEPYNFHLGFSAAGFGMVLGLIQYRWTDRYLGTAGLLKGDRPPQAVARLSRNFYLVVAVVVAAILVFAYLVSSGRVSVTLEQVAMAFGHAIILLAILFFAYLIFNWKWSAAFLALFAAALAFFLVSGFLAEPPEPAPGATESVERSQPAFQPEDAEPSGGEEAEPEEAAGFDVAAQWASGVTLGLFLLTLVVLLAVRRTAVSLERRRLAVIFWLFLLAAVFWGGFEQAGSSLNLFARDLTDRVYFGWEMPTGWLQNVNPAFIILLAPVFGMLWVYLARRKANPSIPLKFALGLVGLAAGFFVLAWGAAHATPEHPVSPAWLVVTYFLHTCGELCLSPVGLSSMTKLAPRDRVGQMMGVWFIAAALGNLFAGLVAGQLEQLAPSTLFLLVGASTLGVGVLALLVSPLVRSVMGDVE